MAASAGLLSFHSPLPTRHPLPYHHHIPITPLHHHCHLRSPVLPSPSSFSLPNEISIACLRSWSPSPSSSSSRILFSSLSRCHLLDSAAAAASGTIVRDTGATALVLAGSYALVSAMDSLAKNDIIEQRLSRKLVHILSGLLFMATWPLFSTSTKARYFAALVPLANCLRLMIYGLSLVPNEELIKSVTREGDPRELLRGPLYYVSMLILCVLVFWRDSPIGVISLAMMCGGDGVADIIGRRLGTMKLPYNQEKSWAGSISMFIFGFVVAIGMLFYFSSFGYIELNWPWTLERVALISLVATTVESLPASKVIDDNISVPLASIATATVFFEMYT